MRQIPKLIIKCVLVMLPVIVLCVYFRTHLLSFIDGEGPYYIWNREAANTASEKDYSVIVLGDSSANAAYVPELLSDDTINLALGGLSPIENYYTLEDWLNNHTPPKVCYISFFDATLSNDGYFWTRAYYAHRYSLRQNLEALKTARDYNEKIILGDHPWLDVISYELYLPNKYITPFMNASFNQRHASNAAAVITVGLHGGRYITRGTDEYAPAAEEIYDSLAVRPMFDYYYRKMIGLCYEKDIAVRIVKLPLPDNAVFADGYADSFYAYYDELQKEYPGLTVDWFPLYPRELFADNRHANAHGALRFSSELKELYPEDFANDSFSAERIKAVNESIQIENKVPQIIQWIKDKDYTVVLCGGCDDLDAYYAEKVEPSFIGEGLTLRPADVEPADRLPGVYYISGLNNDEQEFSVSRIETGVSIQLDGSESQAWYVPEERRLGLAVIDNYNDSIVCVKTFRYVDGSFVAA